MFTKSFLFATLVANALAVPTPDTTVLHEKRNNAYASKANRIARDAVIPIRIAIQQSNLDSAYAHLMDVSHPASTNFGKHWTSAEVDAMFAPSSHSISTVRDWLVANGVTEGSITTTRSGGWLAVDMPVSQAESLFRAEYHEYEDTDGSLRIGCDEYHLPKRVSEHIDFIRPAVALSPPMTKKTVKRSKFGRGQKNQKRTLRWRPRGPGSATPALYNTTSLSNCGSSITPDCIKALYGIPDATISAEQDPANSMGLYESGDVYSQEDLNLYFAKYAPYVPQGTAPILNSIDGATAPVGINSTLNTGESDIDMDMAYSLIYPQSITLYQASTRAPSGDNEYIFVGSLLDEVDGSFCNEAEQADLQCGALNLTRVISISYDSPEFGDQPANAQRACNEIMKLSLQGHTIIVSSGDYGVASHPSGENNGCADSSSSPDAKSGNVFQPQFPATCPYVLAVGATMLTSNQTVYGPESVMNPGADVSAAGVGATFTSGGGFSNYFTAPDYQSSVLASYFSNSDPGFPYYNDGQVGYNNGVYNRNGRGIPDVSANGAYFTIFNQGQEGPFFGTSLAAPLWGSIITLINEERCAAGKGPVGFINPTLYEHPEVFTDITIGSNPGCNTNGFPAVAGWDPVTGLGTPKYQSLSQLMQSLP